MYPIICELFLFSTNIKKRNEVIFYMLQCDCCMFQGVQYWNWSEARSRPLLWYKYCHVYTTVPAGQSVKPQTCICSTTFCFTACVYCLTVLQLFTLFCLLLSAVKE